MPILTKEQILEADDLITETVEVPEWGGHVIVTTMTGAGRDMFERQILEGNTGGEGKSIENIRAKLLASTMVDDEGRLLFSAKDIERLSRKSAAIMDRIFAVAKRLNAIGKQDMEELEKNSPATPSGSSTSS